QGIVYCSFGLKGTVNDTLCDFGGCDSGPFDTVTVRELPSFTSSFAFGDWLMMTPSSTVSEYSSFLSMLKSYFSAYVSASLIVIPLKLLRLTISGPSLISNITCVSLGTTSSPSAG